MENEPLWAVVLGSKKKCTDVSTWLKTLRLYSSNINTVFVAPLVGLEFEGLTGKCERVCRQRALCNQGGKGGARLTPCQRRRPLLR